ncbi:MAG: ATP-binding protein [Bacteroidia bacterium]|nr:ATP-binding protein [Bacteroidia bacterium]
MTEEYVFLGELAWRPEDTIEAWGLRFLHTLRRRLPLLSAALYGVIEADKIEYIASYGVVFQGKGTLEWGEGLIGEAARHQRPFLYQPEGAPPHSYGFGVVYPRYHWVYPWVYQAQTWAVVESLLLRQPTPDELSWLEHNQRLLGMLLSNVFQQQRIRRLLVEQQRQNELLRENIIRLEEARAELNNLNASLEERVRQRTQELESALRELRSAQQQLILSEKMAALGQLVAGVAHEINSPLGAIKGSAETLLDALPQLLSRLAEASEPDWTILNHTLRWLNEYFQTAQRPVLTSKEERALRKRYASELESKGLSEADTLARRLVEAGIILEDFSPLLPALRLPYGPDILYLLGQLKLQLENIVTAANRTRKTVFALKSYAHTTDHTKPTLTRLDESVETILTLYQNQLKQGITVYTEWDPKVPPLYLFSDEIGQVWTNLIQNAIQAMQGQGELRVEIHLEGEEVAVSVIDNGPGIPPEILPRIFEPFFTTKAKGEGTGLGLDICRRIIEKHRGRLTVDSQPGYTRFTAFLPLSLQKPDWYPYEPHPQRV